MEQPYNFSKNIFIFDKRVLRVIIQSPELDWANIGKMVLEYNFSALISLSFKDFISFILVNVYCFVFNIKDKLSSSSFEAMFNNTANFLSSSKILTLLSFSLHILDNISIKHSYCFTDQTLLKNASIKTLK